MTDLISIVDFIFVALTFLIVGRALLSWFDPGGTSRIGQIIFNLTEPLIGPIRRYVPSFGPIDISPIIAIILIQLVRRFVVQALS